MTGLRKQKEYDWKDSNLALFGSDTERQVKKESAQQEPAWAKAGKTVGLQIWRIEKFKVVEWPLDLYGQFYEGDSYIILNTYKEEDSEALLYDVHFWIGKYSTSDEYGTAAYKTVELDTLLDDVPIQHREVQGYESALFKSYFKEIQLLEGGVESGFNHVEPEKYKSRLLHFYGDGKAVLIKQVPKCRENLNSNDSYILDLGPLIYVWNGSGCNPHERIKARDFARQLNEKRNGRCKIETLDESAVDNYQDEFYDHLTEDKKEDVQIKAADQTKQLYRLSDATGQLDMKLEAEGKFTRSNLDTKDVFILDAKSEIFVWIGKQTSKNEKKNAMAYAHKYLQSSDHPYVSVSCLHEERENRAFKLALAA